MTATAAMIITRGGTILPLDQRRRDALANYAELEAAKAAKPKLTWVRETWPLQLHEAKDLLKGNASEAVWERILKLKDHPHGGWRVAIPIQGAVIGQSLEEFIAAEMLETARAAERYEMERAELGQMARDVGALFGLGGGGGRGPDVRDGRPWRTVPRSLGSRNDEAPVAEPRSFDTNPNPRRATRSGD